MNELSSPHVRQQLIGYLTGLSDIDYQHSNWKVFNHDSNTYDELDYTIHFLYDDTYIAENPGLTIGDVLYDRDEVHAITLILEAFEKIFGKYGLHMPDAAYIAAPEWGEVVDSAKAALALLKRRDCSSSEA